MPKNKYFIQQAKSIEGLKKEFERQLNMLSPEIYAAIAIALFRKGYGYEQIYDIFADSQEIWAECVEKDIDMPTMCLEETGVDVRLKTE